MNKIATQFAYEDDRLIIARSQDCTPIAEYAKALHNAGLHGSADMKLAAKIPDVVVEKYMNDNGVTFEQVMSDPIHFKRICNNPDNAAFRIWKGAI